ncbi:hypothetical protein [Pandoraea terrae]|nr:hypothetical protein [Pandoraea terrae]
MRHHPDSGKRAIALQLAFLRARYALLKQTYALHEIAIHVWEQEGGGASSRPTAPDSRNT